MSHVLLRLRAQQYLCRTVKLRAIDIVPRARGSHITHTHTLTTHTCGMPRRNPVRATFHHVSPGAIARMCAPPCPSPNAPPPAAQPPSEPTPDTMLHAEPTPDSPRRRPPAAPMARPTKRVPSCRHLRHCLVHRNALLPIVTPPIETPPDVTPPNGDATGRTTAPQDAVPRDVPPLTCCTRVCGSSSALSSKCGMRVG